mgnify:CR=1 FL=1
MKFTGICPITKAEESIEVHPIYCGSNEQPGYYMKGRIVFCSALDSKDHTCEGDCPIKQAAPDIFRLDQTPSGAYSNQKERKE